MTKRLISVSEAYELHDCEQKWDYKYGGHALGGFTLKRRNPAITLRRGRAWGRAVATWHEYNDEAVAVEALRLALEEDADEQRAAAVYVEEEHTELLAYLLQVLGHYTATSERLVLTDPEFELRVPLPSRGGRRRSNRYVFQAFLDGLVRDSLGLWIYEAKLRGQLSTLKAASRARQIRWYAWGAEQVLGVPVEGVIVDERLNDIPKPARWVNAKRKGEGIDGKVPSHAVDQMCTEADYVRACNKAGIEPVPTTQEAIAARTWQKRHRIFLRRDEIKRAERELISTAGSLAEMDAGLRYPVTNPSEQRCNGCQLADVCETGWRESFDIDFERTTPKRLREPQEEGTVETDIRLAVAA